MNYKEAEVLSNTLQLVKLSTTTTKELPKKQDDAHKLWNASLLFSNIILASSSTQRLFTRKEFEKFIIHYNQQNSVNLNSDFLFSKFWLREVLGLVHIPEAVRSVTYDYEKYRYHKAEVFFLKSLFDNYPNQTIHESLYKESLLEYEKQNSVKISGKWIADKKWVKSSKEANILKIGNVDYLFNLLEHWNYFAFLNSFKIASQERQGKGFCIKTSLLKSILDKHKKCFPLTPTLKQFEDNKIFVNQKNEHFFSIYQSKPNYWHDLKSKIGGHYWEALMQDNNFSNDEERILNFIDVMLRGSYWPKVRDYISESSKDSFLNASLNLINQEKDISPIENEFIKCYLDQGLGSNYSFQSNKSIQDDSFVFTDDVFERHQQLKHISSKYQNNIFHSQDSRSDLAYLVWLIVELDKEDDTVIVNGVSKRVYYDNIKQLLRSGIDKPYLLWETVHFIRQNKPEVIPYFLVEPDLAALGFYLLGRIKTEMPNREVKHLLTKNILEDGLYLLLNSYLRIEKSNKKNTARLVFQIFQEVTQEKENSLNHIRKAENLSLLIKEREEKEKTLLKIIEDSKLNGGFVNEATNSALLFHIFEDLVGVINNHKTNPKYHNGVIKLPILKLDAFSWLSKFLLYTNYDYTKKELSKLRSLVASNFIDCYIKKIEQNSVEKQKFASSELIEGLPTWSSRNEILARIDWLSPIIVAFESGNLGEFLNPRFKLVNTDEYFHEENHFKAKKIRTHLFVLLDILKAIHNQKSYLKAESSIEIKKAVENSVVELVRKYAQGNLVHGINILDAQTDRPHFRMPEDELLPFLIEMGDHFEDKTKIFQELLETENIVQLLYIHSHSQTEGIKENALNRIKQSNIANFIDQQTWLPQITYVVTELSKNPELQEEAETTLEAWRRTNSRTITRETQKEIFEAQLMQAYYNKDEFSVRNVIEPESTYIVHNEFKPYDYKQFFIGLMRYKEKPEDAYKIFNKLVGQYPQYPTFALNRFGAKVSLALKSQSQQFFKEAINEWYEYEQNSPLSSLNTVNDKVNYNKLTVYLNLNDRDEFNKLYEKLNKAERLSPDMVRLRIKMLVRYEFIDGARKLVDEALNFHKTKEKHSFEFLSDLNEMISKSNPVEEIKSHIDRLSITGKNSTNSLKPLKFEDDFGKQMTNQIVTASKRFLKNVKLYNPNADEDDYNGFIKEILESNLSTYGFHIEDQSKGGRSATGKKAGERDLVICDDTGELSVIEAFKHSTKTVVQEHLTKIFNYSHQRSVFYILAYDFGANEKFKNRWKYYKSNILKKLDYPRGYELISEGISDMTDDFNVTNSAIKICRSTHKSGTEIYHIMLNVNYFVNQ